MLMDYIFVEPLKTKEEVSDNGIITNIKQEDKIDRGVVKYINQFSEEFKVGDLVFFEKNSNYKMKINDNLYYRMRNSNVMCILN